FAGSCGGDFYVWDPAAITQDAPCEYRFHFLQSRQEEAPVAAGDSFWQFVEWTENEGRVIEPADGAPGLVFVPESFRAKEKAHHLKVHAWMKWNDRTVRKLALALREGPRPDEFPVLADALRDAGCDSADLLASCGRDAHDEDRAWVLKVLLG